MYKKIRIFDLDGCLIDSLHRYKSRNGKIDLKFWREHDTAEFINRDTLLPLTKWLKDDLKNPDVYVVFATARACIKNDANYTFLLDHNIVPDNFIHRQGVDDNRGGAELKLAGIKPILENPNMLKATVHIFEDNIKYLYDMVKEIKKTHTVVGHYIPSEQGH